MVRSENPNGVRGHMIFMARADVDLRYVEVREMGRTRMGVLDSTEFDAQGKVTNFGTNQIGRYAIHFHHDFGPTTDAGQRISVHADRQRRGRRAEVGRHGPQQPLRPHPGQRRLQHARRRHRHRGRDRKLQRVRPQLRDAVGGLGRLRAAERLRRRRQRPRRRRRRLLVPRAQQLHSQQRGRQRRRVRLRPRGRRARQHPHPDVQGRGHDEADRHQADRHDRRAGAGVCEQRSVRRHPDRHRVRLERHDHELPRVELVAQRRDGDADRQADRSTT